MDYLRLTFLLKIPVELHRKNLGIGEFERILGKNKKPLPWIQ